MHRFPQRNRTHLIRQLRAQERAHAREIKQANHNELPQKSLGQWARGVCLTPKE